MAEGQCQIQHGHYHHTIAEQREAFPVNVDQYSDKHDEQYRQHPQNEDPQESQIIIPDVNDHSHYAGRDHDKST